MQEEHASKTWGSASKDSWGSSTSGGSKTWGSSSKDSNSWGSSSKDSNWGKGKYEGAFTYGVTSDYGNGSTGYGSMTHAGTFTGAGGKGSDDTEFNIAGTMKNNNSKRSRESNSNWSSSGSSSGSKETWESSSGSSSSKDSWASSNSKDTWASLASRDGWAAAATKEPDKVVTNTWYNSAQVETFTGGSQFNPQTINGFPGTIAAGKFSWYDISPLLVYEFSTKTITGMLRILLLSRRDLTWYNFRSKRSTAAAEKPKVVVFKEFQPKVTFFKRIFLVLGLWMGVGMGGKFVTSTNTSTNSSTNGKSNGAKRIK